MDNIEFDNNIFISKDLLIKMVKESNYKNSIPEEVITEVDTKYISVDDMDISISKPA